MRLALKIKFIEQKVFNTYIKNINDSMGGIVFTYSYPMLKSFDFNDIYFLYIYPAL